MSEHREFASGPKFIELYARGEVSRDEIDDFIDYWHDTAPRGLQTLHAFLGMTWEEYSVWMTEPDALDQILAARDDGGREDPLAFQASL